MRYDNGYFKGKRAICSVTSGAPENTFKKKGRGGGEIQALLHPMNYSLNYMGFTVLPPHLIGEVQGAGFTYKESDAFVASLNQKLEDWERFLHGINTVTPLRFPGWEYWDENGVEKMI